jgi:hypothetical protein
MARWRPTPKLILQKFPNQHIFLYQGFAELINSEQIIEGKVIVKISWYPSPNINCKFVYHGEERIDLENQKNLELKLTELIPQHRLKVRISRGTYSGDKKNQLSGHLIEQFIQGKSDNLSSVVFHLPNFWWFNISNDYDFDKDEKGQEIEIEREDWLMFEGQFIFDYNNWHIVLATLDNCFDLQELLEAEGGYGITHICKVERLDGSQFNLEEVYQIIEAFIYYLSFVRGLWLAPILLSGFDTEGNQLFEEWRKPIIQADSWQSGCQWTDVDSTTEIVAAFPGFLKKWQNETWKEAIKNAIQWYIESLKHSSEYNTSIILVQAALEKIAWTLLNSDEAVSPDGFKKLHFEDKLKLLLKFLKISQESLKDFPNLLQLAKARNWNDSAKAIEEIRNSIVHPKLNKCQQKLEISSEIMIETFSLAHHYLLKCLLKLFEYPYSIE